MNAAARVSVEVVYAHPEVQAVIGIDVPAGATVEEAIRACGILTRFPEIDLTSAAVGVFGARVRLSDALNAGDRIEIYRPLIADPKEARRRRAHKRAAR